MRPSLNEIATTVRKAGIGSGWPVGIAEDIGGAAVWLTARGFDGVGTALRAYGEPVHRPRAQRTAGGWRFQAPCGAASACSAIDLLGAAPGSEIELHGTGMLMLLCGLAGQATGVSGGGYRLIADEAEPIIVHAAGIKAGGAGQLHAGARAQHLRIEWLADLAALTGQPASEPSTGARGYQLLTAPVQIADETWQRAVELASRTHVEPSDASRVRGAGAGLNDND